MENKQLRTNNHIDRKDLIIFGLIILVGIIIAVFVEYKLDVDATIYDIGFDNGAIEWNNYVVNKINSEGLIPVIANGTQQYISLQDLCGRIK